MAFIGREKELRALSQCLKKKRAQLVVIRGRRRIGKSRLAEEFGKRFSKTYIFSGLAPQGNVTAQMQREEFARQVADLFDVARPQADDWGDLFRTLAALTEGKELLLVLDEITWMGGKDPTFLGKLKIAWDLSFKKNPKLFLILSGSISSWIEKNILSSTGFLGRISYDLVLRPLPLSDCNLFWGAHKDRISAWEKCKILSITGGIPRYLEEIDPTLPAEEVVAALCFEPGGLLFREFENIFSDLFARRSETYQAIMHQLVEGSKALSDICALLKIQKTGVISTYLEDLVTAGFLARDSTWHIKTAKESKLSRYRISDNYARFYLKYVEPNRSRIESGSFGKLHSWESIMGLQFENLVLCHRPSIWRLLRLNPSEIIYDNPYFQRKTRDRKDCQIDYLIQTRFGTLYLCEIKFSKEPIGLEVIKEVEQKIEKIDRPKHHSVRPVLIHVNGVKNSLLEKNFFSHVIDFGEFLEPPQLAE